MNRKEIRDAAQEMLDRTNRLTTHPELIDGNIVVGLLQVLATLELADAMTAVKDQAFKDRL